MADTPTFNPNPYANFDPSQWTNPYSKFYGRALPFPPSYAGTPTDALGNPIAVPQGMTLNSTPAQPQAPAAAPGSPLLYGPAGAVNPNGGLTPQRGNIQTGPNQYMSQAGYQALYGGGGQGQPGAAAAPQAAAPAGNNWQTSLAMLANPGHVTTPGATVPQAAQGGGQPSPGVLQNFLANWQPAQSGPGSGFTQNFNTILRGLQAKGS